MHLEEFAEGTTVLHRLDPRVKFLCLVPVVALVAVTHSLTVAGAALTLAAALSALARLSADKLLARLLTVNVFVAMLWIFIPLSVPGEALSGIGPLTVTREGVILALLITLKSNAIVLLTIAVLGTSEVTALAHALLHLRAPGKLVHLFFFFYRYISVLHGEYTRLVEAMRVKGFRARTDSHTMRTLGYLVGMLLVSSHERSGRIYEAMLCRGFTGYFPVARHFHLHRVDYVFMVCSALCLLGFLLLGVHA